MEWPSYTHISSLFPSFDNKNTAHQPFFDIEQPVWDILDPNSQNSVKSQLQNLLNSMDKSKKFEHAGVTIDETKGPVIIEQSAIVEPSTHFIGPCYICLLYTSDAADE